MRQLFLLWRLTLTMTVTSRELQRAVRRGQNQQTARLNELPTLRGDFLTVTAITPTVTVSWRGNDIPVTAPLLHYTPGVGDRVFCVLTADGQLVIVGQSA